MLKQKINLMTKVSFLAMVVAGLIFYISPNLVYKEAATKDGVVIKKAVEPEDKICVNVEKNRYDSFVLAISIFLLLVFNVVFLRKRETDKFGRRETDKDK